MVLVNILRGASPIITGNTKKIIIYNGHDAFEINEWIFNNEDE